MRHLPRQSRVLTTQVNPDADTPTPNGRRVLVVGRFVRPACVGCGGFETVTVSIGGALYTVTCPACTTPTADLDKVMDDIEREDDNSGNGGHGGAK